MSSGLSTICARTDLASTKPLYHVSSNWGSTYSGTGVGTGVGVGVGDGVGDGVGEGEGVGEGADVSITVSLAASEGLAQDAVPRKNEEQARTEAISLRYLLSVFIVPAGLLVVFKCAYVDAGSVTLESVDGNLLVKP